MANVRDPHPIAFGLPQPVIRRIAVGDVFDAFRAGFRDFTALPLYGLFFGGVYAVGGMLIVACLAWFDMVYLAYPFAAGFAMIGPFVACGLYEVSRRREAGEPLSFPIVLGAVWAQRQKELSWMALVVVFLLVAWLYQVRLLIAICLGLRSFATLTEFFEVVTTTAEGWQFLILGHVVGAILSVIAFSLTVISFPLLVDRDHDFITALITSVQSVITNPLPMAVWGACVIALLVIASAPLFLGLVVVLPVLGHATWHLYRKVIAPLPAGQQTKSS